MRLGGPVFVESGDPEVLARAHRAEGYRAAYCPSTASLDDPGGIHRTSAAFAAADVVIAEVGAWCNLLSPDPARRKHNIDYVCRQLALADEVGALCCVDYAGTLAPEVDYGPHPANLSEACFEQIVATVRGILRQVNPRRTRFTLEMMPAVFPDDADSYLRLIAAIDHPRFGVHLDPVNIITSPRRYFANGAVIRECFAKLGPHIASCHAKDAVMSARFMVEITECPIGQGALDYGAFLTELGRLPHPPPLMLEHLQTPEQYRQARDHLVRQAGGLGLSFDRG